MRLLDSLASTAKLPQSTVDTLKTAYCFYRDKGHKQALQDNNALIDQAEVAELRLLVGEIWDQLLA
jgi:glutamate-ammonia-ligase adenylyltransferase